ncbi:copper resistance protein CopC [Actinomadura sp. GC306]|uniref:copper resistance CopC family protein n=1 Tax=Actinomadura sp. GC306 TaxID=2530367 RepID=UPI00104B5393|nr:copper resistance protein CopC [Actinomadura sp. GC306]TDC64773.1 copper resistance protein CopC [Actinomadura sp. GC306]
MNILKFRRPARGLGIAALAAALLTVVMAPPALAHPRLTESTPAMGATAEKPAEVKLVFSEKINVAEVVVRDGTGKTFQKGEAELSGTTVTQRLAGTLPVGIYSVAYRVVGQDGHPVQSDRLTFTAVGGPTPPPVTGLPTEIPTGGAAPAPPAGGVGAAEQTGPAATADEEPLKIDQEQAAEEEKGSGSGALLWVLIIAGLLIGIGIGLGIVYRAKRKHQAGTGGE